MGELVDMTVQHHRPSARPLARAQWRAMASLIQHPFSFGVVLQGAGLPSSGFSCCA
jgi:hypothetical protein